MVKGLSELETLVVGIEMSIVMVVSLVVCCLWRRKEKREKERVGGRCRGAADVGYIGVSQDRQKHQQAVIVVVLALGKSGVSCVVTAELGKLEPARRSPGHVP